MATALILHLKEMLSSLELPLGQLWEEVNLAPQSLSVSGKGSPERGRSQRPEMQGDQVDDGGLHLGGIILKNLGAHGCLTRGK